MMQTGQQHIAGLRDRRAAYVDGRRVDDMTRHLAFACAIQSVGMLHGFSSYPANAELMIHV